MPIAALMDSRNWRSVVRELLLIVVGVTLALMATSWYESRAAKQEERLFLEQISLALEADLADLQARFEALKQSEQQLLSLLDRLDKDALGPEADGYFEFVALWRGGVLVRSGPYDVLKAQGFSLISNDSLRLKLVDLYERGFGGLASTTAIDQDFSLNQVLPYIYANFERGGSGYLVPVNGYAALDSDTYFQNLVEAKLERLQDRLLPGYERIIALVEEVLTELRRELGKP